MPFRYSSMAMPLQHQRTARTARVVLAAVVIAAAGIWWAIIRSHRAYAQDVGMHAIIWTVGDAVFGYTAEYGKPPQSVDELIKERFLAVRDGRLYSEWKRLPDDIATPDANPPFEIRLHFPESIVGWSIVDGVVKDSTDAPTELPFIEIVGRTYPPGRTLAKSTNKRFARIWLEVMQGKEILGLTKKRE